MIELLNSRLFLFSVLFASMAMLSACAATDQSSFRAEGDPVSLQSHYDLAELASTCEAEAEASVGSHVEAEGSSNSVLDRFRGSDCMSLARRMNFEFLTQVNACDCVDFGELSFLVEALRVYEGRVESEAYFVDPMNVQCLIDLYSAIISSDRHRDDGQFYYDSARCLQFYNVESAYHVLRRVGEL